MSRAPVPGEGVQNQHRRGESMSDRERELIHKLETFPQELRERFFDRLEGAAMALEALQREANDEK